MRIGKRANGSWNLETSGASTAANFSRNMVTTSVPQEFLEDSDQIHTS